MEYTTHDFTLAATLLCFEYKLLRLEKDVMKEGRALFVFEPKPDMEEFIKKFWNNEVRVEPKSFYYYGRDLKTQIRETLERR